MEEFDEVIHGLRDLYVGELRAHGAELSRELKALETADPAHRPHALKDILVRAHRLAGTGATFGAVDVSRCGEEFEVLLRQVLAGDAPMDLRQISDLGARLLQAVGQVA